MKNMYYALEEDLSGKNPTNRITEEPHDLSDVRYRAIIPYKGLFFTNSVLIRDGDRVLRRGIDWVAPGTHSKLSISSGSEVGYVILILDEKVRSTVTIDYQAVGGVYSIDNKLLAEIYENWRRDGRTVAFKDILGLPDEYNPGPHTHHSRDLVGLGEVVHVLERINASISIGQVGLLDATLTLALDRWKCGEVPKAISHSGIFQKDAVLNFLSRRKMLSNFWVDVKSCHMYYGRMMTIIFDTCDLEVGEIIHWQIFKENLQKVQLPIQEYGSVKVAGPMTEVQIYVPAPHVHQNEILYIGALKESTVLEWYDRENQISETVDKPIRIAGVTVYPNGKQDPLVEPEPPPMEIPEYIDNRPLNTSRMGIHPLKFQPTDTTVVRDKRYDFVPILQKFTNRFKGEFDAVSYKIAFLKPPVANTNYAFLMHMRMPLDSDSLNHPALYRKNDFSRTRYLLDHFSMFKYQLR